MFTSRFISRSMFSMFRSINIICLFIAFSLSLSLAFLNPSTTSFAATIKAGGSIDSGGVDLEAIDSGAAWFLGDRTVRYCIEVSSDFGANVQEIDQVLQSVFTMWSNYLTTRTAYQKLRGEHGYPFLMDIAKKYQLVTNCANKNASDIVFYFGVVNNEIEKARNNFDNPVAFIKRTNYDMDNGWAKGFVWVSKKYSSKWISFHLLDVILLHEMGHVLGNGHLSETIMDQNIAKMMDYIVNSPYGTPHTISTYFEIDWFERLLTIDLSSVSLKGSLHPDTKKAKKIFKELTGREAVGNIRANFMNAQVTSSTGMTTTESCLVYQDDQSSFYFHISRDVFETEDYLKLFKITSYSPFKIAYNTISSDDGRKVPQSFSAFTTIDVNDYAAAGVYSADLIINNGKKIPILVGWNMGVTIPSTSGHVSDPDASINPYYVFRVTPEGKFERIFGNSSDKMGNQ
ncbi:MAG: hypothetical protein HQK49_20095 [Oligoflexia bacterium]|nr:hypothetical protein [Oligoflexia bacterium]